MLFSEGFLMAKVCVCVWKGGGGGRNWVDHVLCLHVCLEGVILAQVHGYDYVLRVFQWPPLETQVLSLWLFASLTRPYLLPCLPACLLGSSQEDDSVVQAGKGPTLPAVPL